ncbi:similar to Saccharomyces cerevisiae YKL009W MRT4 Protein involved in mRNA turnover and ribosome assembly, localizes to the nucleolus [Maudiozyma saulgeensis]|uniref:Ribosome assembly factor mrt4 n=1 Tax=Maudiozyma saulgeensis TaxID=1789683 RepID=A0A1X7R882_9SACH|nr:similar to Saccharomyces cerevisiae YKL009W MRT4 Protein involved in mRNA turnover and ribosome assembly, localizes to the nucleolus [Kazachstania saulgeensis]
MPRSKRSKLVTLAQTDKKGRANKERIFDEVREGLDTYRYVWLMLLDNVRTPVLQEIRQAWTGSKLLMGKRKVLEKALGDTRENEYKENLYKFTKLCNGVTGLLFTDETPEVVEEYFNAYEKADFSRPNSKAPISFTIPEGIIYSRGGQIPTDDDIPMVHSLEPTLRTKYEIPTKIKAGKITLEAPYVVCQEGETLDVRKALILKQFGIAASVFKVKLAGYYDNDSSEVTTTKINIE